MPIPNSLTDAQEALAEAKEELISLLKEFRQIKKNGEQPSPGLLDAIKRLETKVEHLMDMVTLWKVFLREYPNYDR